MTNKYLWWYALPLALCIGCGQEVKFIEIKPMKIEFHNTGETKELQVIATTSRGETVKEPQKYTFSSENPAVAEVSQEGVVRAVGNGNAAVTAKAPNGISGEVFVSVCLPKELACDPASQIDTRVRSANPLRCRVLDCKGRPVSNPQISFDIAAKDLAKGENADTSQEGVVTIPIAGAAEGDTQIKVSAYGFEKTIRIHVDKALVIPGEAAFLANEKKKRAKGKGK